MSDEKPNKAEAIREALATLGSNSMPTAVVEHLKKKGVEVSSNYVSMEKSKLKKAGESGLLPVPSHARAATTTAVRKPAGPNMVELILTIKQLIFDVGGKDELKKLIDAL